MRKLCYMHELELTLVHKRPERLVGMHKALSEAMDDEPVECRGYFRLILFKLLKGSAVSR